MDLGGGGLCRVRLALALALCALGIVAPPAGADSLHLLHSRVALRVPATRHRSVTRSTVRLPRALAGYYAYFQVVRGHSRGPRIALGRRLVMTGAHGRPALIVALTGRYSATTGRLRLAMNVDNVRQNRRKHPRVRVL